MHFLSIGWSRIQAISRIAQLRWIFGLALVLQLIVGGLFLFAPTFSLGVVNMSPSMGPEWPSIWGATLIFVTVLQIPGVIDPLNQRYTNVIAVLGRALMVATFLSFGGQFVIFAVFDLAFGLLIFFGFRRAVIAELQSRPRPPRSGSVATSHEPELAKAIDHQTNWGTPMTTVRTTAHIMIPVSRPALYEWLVPGVFDTELDTVLRDEAGFAGVTRTTGTTGPWNVPQSTRIVHQYDGTFSRETVLHATAPDYFAYRLTDFSSRRLKLMAREAGGQWWFTDNGAGTDVKWTYSAEATSILTVPILIPVLKILWNRSMRSCLARIKARAEAELKGEMK